LSLEQDDDLLAGQLLPPVDADRLAGAHEQVEAVPGAVPGVLAVVVLDGAVEDVTADADAAAVPRDLQVGDPHAVALAAEERRLDGGDVPRVRDAVVLDGDVDGAHHLTSTTGVPSSVNSASAAGDRWWRAAAVSRTGLYSSGRSVNGWAAA